MKDIAKAYGVSVPQYFILKRTVKTLKHKAQKQFNFSSECVTVREFWKRYTIRDVIFDIASCFYPEIIKKSLQNLFHWRVR